MAAATAAKVAYDFWRNRPEPEPAPPAPPPPPPPPPESEAEREERLRREAAEKKRKAEEKRRREEEKQRKEEAAREEFFVEQQALWKQIRVDDFRIRDTIETLTMNIKFTGRKVLVGRRKTGEKFMGVFEEEVPYPCDEIRVRQIMGFHERHLLLPSELAYPPQIVNSRIASGEALVMVHIKQTPDLRELYEPVYETEIKTLYLLIDVSPSMWDDLPDRKEWRVPLWRGLAMRLIERALASGAPCVVREFSTGCRERQVIMETAAARLYRKRLWNMPKGNGTDISDAIQTAIRDLQYVEYSTADIMIITDGEDKALSASKIRPLLEAANIKLHAIMLGVENNALRECCDMYQILEPDLTIQPLVKRK